MTIKELEAQYKEQADRRKGAIRKEPSKAKRFWKWVLYLLTYPFVWAWYNFRDWRTFLIFIIVMLVVGIEVWLPFLLGLIFNNAWLLGIAATCEAFWLLPGTPFLPLCIFITIVIKGFINRKRKKDNGYHFVYSENCEKGCYNCKHEYMNCINDNICSSCRLQDSGIELTNTRHGCSRWERKKDEN